MVLVGGLTTLNLGEQYWGKCWGTYPEVSDFHLRNNPLKIVGNIPGEHVYPIQIVQKRTVSDLMFSTGNLLTYPQATCHFDTLTLYLNTFQTISGPLWDQVPDGTQDRGI